MITFFDAYEWLHKYDRSHLRLASRMLVEKLHSAIDVKDERAVGELIDQLTLFSKLSPDELELAEVYVEAGKAVFELGYYQYAAKFLEQAATRYGVRWHYYAVVQWMLGYVYWCQEGQKTNAIQAWQRSIDKFKNLADRKLISRETSQWYSQSFSEMRTAMELTIENPALPAQVLNVEQQKLQSPSELRFYFEQPPLLKPPEVVRHLPYPNQAKSRGGTSSDYVNRKAGRKLNKRRSSYYP